jgi:Ni/Co efflux regulator RcnB
VKKLLTTTLLLAVVAAPAAAQIPGQGDGGARPNMNLLNEGMHLKTDEEVKQEQEKERAYKAGMSKIPDQKVKVDPWGAVRTAPPSATVQRPAAK